MAYTVSYLEKNMDNKTKNSFVWKVLFFKCSKLCLKKAKYQHVLALPVPNRIPLIDYNSPTLVESSA